MTRITPMLYHGCWFGCCLFGFAAMALAAGDEAPGVQVGEKAPAFALRDQNGDEHTLSDMLGKGSVALVFHRSADW